MQYRNDVKSGNNLSILGYGCMRLPRSMGTKIDVDKTESLIMSAIDMGINYFDSAYIYPGSEQAVGDVFRRNKGAREKIYLATKLPHSQCKSFVDFDKFFDVSLSRLETDWIDYYLIHNIGSLTAWERLKSNGIEKWIDDKKAQGKIRQIGFSFHGPYNEFNALIDAYDWDFTQIQYNYMNENYQAGRAGLVRAHEKGMSVVVMEPLLGGKLATSLPKGVESVFRQGDKDSSPAAWALRWIWNQPEVTLLLSGMNSDAQLNENVETAKTAVPGMLTDKEVAIIERVVKIFEESYKIPCTGCNYCLPCPNNVNIPGSFASYNLSFASGYIAGITSYMTGTALTSKEGNFSGSNCIKCGLCEQACPQKIKIMGALETVLKRMEPFWMKPIISVVRKVMK
ncbi:MAG: aldo/keto reductase [Oscillospiraceae bacterium]|nr:aldo/keto reductase [Oscillospiraceae bacterium]